MNPLMSGGKSFLTTFESACAKIENVGKIRKGAISPSHNFIKFPETHSFSVLPETHSFSVRQSSDYSQGRSFR
jgi:hypothetical protein